MATWSPSWNQKRFPGRSRCGRCSTNRKRWPLVFPLWSVFYPSGSLGSYSALSQTRTEPSISVVGDCTAETHYPRSHEPSLIGSAQMVSCWRSSVIDCSWPFAGEHLRRVAGTQPHAIGLPHCGHWWKLVNAATRVYDFPHTRRSILTGGFRAC